MNKFYTSEKISENIEETPEGFLICKNVPVARLGNQTYKADEVPIEPNKDGLVEIKRVEEEVFKPETLQSFEGKPFTIDHPDEMVTPENWKDLAHGYITNIRRGIREQADLMIGDIVASTKKVIELIKNGMREISCGYDADYEQVQPGVGIQKNIIGNHIALVMRGRAGHRCAIGDKQCTNCGKCNCNDIKIEEDEDAMRFKDKLRKAYRKLVKDDEFEKLSEEEKADKLAEVASDAVETESGVEEPTGEEIPAEEIPAEETPVEEPYEEPIEEPIEEPVQEVTNADLSRQIDRLIGIIEAFVKSAASISGDEALPDPMPNEEEAKPFINDEGGGSLPPSGGLPKIAGNSPVKIPAKAPAVDEDPEEKEERERKEAKDCDSVWHDVAYRADLLYPGIRITKPTKDHRITLDNIKRKALKKSFATDAETVSVIVSENKVDSLTKDALNIAFIAASEAVKSKNNRYVKDSIVTNTKAVTNDIRSIQERNKQFWGKK